jgi:type I restriction enzyme S subunit
MATSQDFVNWVCSDALDPRFLMFALMAEGDHILTFGKGSTHTTIYFPEVLAFHIALPPIAEQHRIVEMAGALLKRVNHGAERLRTAERHLRMTRNAVLNAAYDGSLISASVSQYVRFDDVCIEIRGGNSTTSGSVKTEWAVLKSSAVRPFDIDFEDLNYLNSSGKCAPNAEVRQGDLLITRLSGSVEYVGNCALVRNRPAGTLQIPDRIFRARVRPDFDARYVEIMFNAPAARKPLEEAAKSSAGHQRISLSDLREVAIPRLPREQQLAIVQRFSTISRSLRAVAMRISVASRSSRDLASAILAKAVAGELVPTEAELARRQGRSYEPASILLDRIRVTTARTPVARRRR